MDRENNFVYADILNILACICVVWIHHTLDRFYAYSNSMIWFCSVAITSLCFCAVPIFLMLSGANLLNYRSRYSTKEFLKKRLRKVLVPFLFWSLFILIMKSTITELGDSKFIIESIINNSMEVVYWYIPIQISMYLLMPILSVLVELKKKNLLIYLTVIIFVFQSVAPAICDMFKIKWNTNLGMTVSGYCIFILLGYLLSNNLIKISNLCLYIIGISILLFRIIYTIIFAVNSLDESMIFFNYLYFPTVLWSIAIFRFINSINWRLKPRTCNILKNISSCSFGIYLVHKIIMRLEVEIFNLDIYSTSWIFAWTISTYCISFLLVYIIKKIPLLKNIV